ncbi:IS3 family transposase [Rhodocytophaga aerolata]
MAENFFRTLKTELIHQMEVKPVAMAKIKIFEFMN